MKTCFKASLLLLLGTIFIYTRSDAQNADFGKSYINISKGLNGGTLETGDTLEIRATFVVRNLFTSYDSCAFYDTIPAGTTYIPGTLRVTTNEGLTYKQFTDSPADTDEGWITGAGYITMHLGYNQASGRAATRWRRGRVASSHRPSFFFACIMVMSYRIVVNAATGSTIYTSGGVVTYKNGAAAETRYRYPNNAVMLYPNYGMCANSLGGNSIGTESNGSFGSGIPQNRAASTNVPPSYTYTTFTSNSPDDYYYGIANNTCNGSNYTTSDAWPRPDNVSSPTHRIFEKWDIIGDHTGASNPAIGNPPGNNSTVAGYLLVINASYRIDSAFTQVISGLCPNTYYEISTWVRNICRTCGFDSTGKAPTAAGYIPTAPGDSSGVYPNLTFEVNGIDYYTTGNVKYTGQWVKKGFTYLTGPAQTTINLKLFNNAPGGGGNDWAVDDISVATCTPDLAFTPSNDPSICEGNVVELSCNINSFFDNYAQYKWQRSTDNGVTWMDSGSPGTASPTWNGSSYEYSVSYPMFVANHSDSGYKYRVLVATTSSNLSSPACSFTESSVITLRVLPPCGPPLLTDMISFSGRLENNKVQLTWTTGSEIKPVQYLIEKSVDGKSFVAAGITHGDQSNTSETNRYNWSEPYVAGSTYYYRIKMLMDNKQKISNVIRISSGSGLLDFVTVMNPFSEQLLVYIYSRNEKTVSLRLIDNSGRVVYQKPISLTQGSNQFVVDNTKNLSAGLYTLQLQTDDILINKRVLKH